jgi:hypothetical protein
VNIITVNILATSVYEDHDNYEREKLLKKKHHYDVTKKTTKMIKNPVFRGLNLISLGVRHYWDIMEPGDKHIIKGLVASYAFYSVINYAVGLFKINKLNLKVFNNLNNTFKNNSFSIDDGIRVIIAYHPKVDDYNAAYKLLIKFVKKGMMVNKGTIFRIPSMADYAISVLGHLRSEHGDDPFYTAYIDEASKELKINSKVAKTVKHFLLKNHYLEKYSSDMVVFKA